MYSVILAGANIPCKFTLKVIKKDDILRRAIFHAFQGLNKQKAVVRRCASK